MKLNNTISFGTKIKLINEKKYETSLETVS